MKITAILLSVLALVPFTVTAASVTYQLTINTSSIAGQSGYLDLQLNPGDNTSQLTTLGVSGFSTDGTPDSGAPYNAAYGDVTGTLPGTLSFDNGQTTNEYTEGILFGNTLTAQLTFDGPAIESPNGGTASLFVVDLLNSSETANLLTADPNALTAYSWSVATISVNPDGSATPTTYADAGGSFDATVTPLPEPSTLPLMALSLLLLRRKAANAKTA